MNGVPLFDGWQSYGHSAIGFLAAKQGLNVFLVISFLFILYQLNEPEDRGKTVGDLVEYAVGSAAYSIFG